MINIEKINSQFYSFGSFIVRHRWLNIIFFLAVLGLCFCGLKYVQSDTNQENYFLEGDELVKVRKHFEKVFGNDDFCGILVESEDVFSAQTLTLIRELGRQLKAEVPYVDDIVSLTDLEYVQGTDDSLDVTDLVPDPVPDSAGAREAMRAKAMLKPSIKGRLVSDDSRQTWVMVRLKVLPDGVKGEHGRSLEEEIGAKVNEVSGRPQFAALHPRTTGLPVINVDKRAFVAKETPKLIGLSLLLTLVLLAVFLRMVRGIVFPFISSVAALVIVFGLQGFLGIVNDPAMIFLPIFLGLSMAIAYAVYLMGDFRQEFLTTGRLKQSVADAIGSSGWPIGFSALTTIVALVSFCFVPLKPIRWMGLTAAALTGLLYVLTVTLLPSMLAIGRDRSPQKLKARKSGPVDRLVGYLGRHVLSRPALTLCVLAGFVALSACGLANVNVSFDLRNSFGMKVPYVQRICEVADSQVGSLYSYGVGVELRNSDDAKKPENLRRLGEFSDFIKSLPLTKRASSILDILKDMNQTLHGGEPGQYRIADTQEEIAQQLLLYENAGGREAEHWVDYDYRRLRLLIEIGDYRSGEAARELELIKAKGRELFPDASILLTGALIQFSVMQDYVSWGQIQSFGISILVISLLMSIVFGSVKLGLVSMIPNISPALLAGAMMGYFDFPLDIMTVTVMPMLLGLSVDDTIHFINHAQLEFSRTGSYAESVRRTFLTTGRSMMITTVILCVCFLAYLISDIAVFFRLGILVAGGAVAALLADYFVTPVLLAKLRCFGPEGRPASGQTAG